MDTPTPAELASEMAAMFREMIRKIAYHNLKTPSPSSFDEEGLPWRPGWPKPNGVLDIVSTISLVEVVALLKDKKAQAAVQGYIDNAVERFIDDYCGTGWPNKHHFGNIGETVEQLVGYANSYKNAAVQKAILNVAVTITERTFQQQG